MTIIRLSSLACTLALASAAVAAGAQTGTTTAATPTPMATPTPAATATTTADATAPAASATATANPTVGGAPMIATKTIVENAAAAPNLTTLVSAVKAAGLVATLSGPGPFTVFAPTNEAFGRLAPGTLDTLVKPANKATLTKVLTYHVIAGKLTLADLQAKVKAGGGTATLTTVAGQSLTVTYANNAMTLTDPAGNKSYVETADVMQSNGVVHVVNGVLVPKLQ